MGSRLGGRAAAQVRNESRQIRRLQASQHSHISVSTLSGAARITELNEEITEGKIQQNMQILLFHVDSHHVDLSTDRYTLQQQCMLGEDSQTGDS